VAGSKVSRMLDEDCRPKHAPGQADGLAALMVYYCERASGFSAEDGLQDEGFFVALVRMFEQTLKAIARLPDAQRPPPSWNVWMPCITSARTSDTGSAM